MLLFRPNWSSLSPDKYIRQVKANSKTSTNLRVCFIYHVGKGVFTTRPFNKGHFLLCYKGEIITGREGERREQAYPDESGIFLYFYKDNGKTCWYA